MAGEGRMLFIEGKWVDTASPEFQKSMKRMKGEAQKQGKQIGGLVDEKMGRAMGAFNEKTEKGKMLLTTFGGAFGGVAGEMVYHMGTFSYVIGRFSLMEMGIMGLIAAVGGLVYAFVQLDKEEKERQKILKDHLAEMEKLNAELRKAEMMASGMSAQKIAYEIAYADYEATKWWADKTREEYMKARADKEIDLDELREIGHRAVHFKRLLAQAEAKLNIESLKNDAAYAARRKAQDEKAAEDEERRKKERLERLKREREQEQKLAREGGGIGSIGWGLTQQLEPFMGMLVPAGTADRLMATMQAQMTEQRMQAQERIEIERLMTEVYEEEAEKRIEAIAEEQRAAREREIAQRQSLQNTIGLFSELGEIITRGTKAHTAARIASIIMQAAYDTAVYTYKGFAALADPTQGPWAAANYFTAAALAAVVAAGNIQEAASGGGGGGASVGARESAQGGWGSREPEKSEGLVIHIHAGVLTGSDAGKEILNAIQDHDDAWSPGRVRKGMG